MTTIATTFDDRFAAIFASGVADIKFFVRKGSELSVDDLRAELLEFQSAVDEKKVERVDSIDDQLPQVDFQSAW